MNRGEVWWAEDPESGRRPYLILTRSVALPVLYKITAVPATRTDPEHPVRATAG